MPAESAGPPRHAGFRYGAAFAVTLLVVMVVIVAPGGDVTLAAVLALQSAALVVVVATSRARRETRRAWGLLAAGAGVLLTVAVAAGAVSSTVVHAFASVLGISIPLALGGGLARLVRSHGVTLQAVAGALTIYLYIGLTFAWIIGLVARFDAAPFFSEGGDATESDRVYYSFTVMTTTGFGDLTAATQLGHALAVLEMLVGQLYLVTVIGVLVGSFGRR